MIEFFLPSKPDEVICTMFHDNFSFGNFRLFLPATPVEEVAVPPAATIVSHPGLFRPRSGFAPTYTIAFVNAAASSIQTGTRLAADCTIELLCRGQGLGESRAEIVLLDDMGNEKVLARISRQVWRIQGERIKLWVGRGVDVLLVVCAVVAMKLRRRRVRMIASSGGGGGGG